MSIILNDNIEVRAPKPIDSRTSLSTIAERDAIPLYYRYNGMPVWVDETSSNYRWYNDMWNLEDYSVSDNYKLHDSLFDVFEPVTVRNLQFDNEDVTGGTRWTITNIDSVNKIITFDNPLPFLTGLKEHATQYDKWGCYVSYFEAVIVEDIDYQNNTITYTAGFGTISVGDKVTFFNPFRRGSLISNSPLLANTKTWCSTYVHPAGVWKHSDGTYRMFVNGYSGSILKIGLASSPDLETWSYVGNNALFVSGTAPFNKSWMGTGGMFSVSNPQKIHDSDKYYYALFTIKNPSGLWESVVCVIDEDANIIRIADNPITIPGHANTHGNQAGTIVYVDGHYSIFIVNRAAALYNWTIYEMRLGDPISNTVISTTLVTKGTNTASWYGSHTDALGSILYNNKLYLFVGGTGLATNDAEIWRSNRQYGIFTKEDGVWTNYKSNPVLCNPVLGNYIWNSSLSWCSDHMGGYYGSYIKDNFLYIFLSMNAGTDTYRVGGWKFNLLDNN